MKKFSELRKNLKNKPTSNQPIKISLLGDSATQFLNVALQGTAVEMGLDVEILEADFGQIERQILDPDSAYYQFSPDYTILFESSHKLLTKFNKSKTDPTLFAENKMQDIQNLCNQIQQNTKSKIIYCNFAPIDNQIFGNFAHKTATSFVYQLQRLNFLISDFAIANPNFFVADLASIQNKWGRNTMFSPNIYINSEMLLSIEVLPVVANSILSTIAALTGKFKKCLILDLDNTTWGGIIGDDGLEKIQIGSLGIGKAFTEFQYWVKSLQKRGIILAVCSKNDEDKAKEPFEKHPDMVLKLDDIAVFVANWENKADNIRKIQKILNIGFDSMVFLDDNPFERNLVRENLPDVCVPELPEDPAEYLEYLYGLQLFETASFSENDAERTKQYQVEAQRTIALDNFTNVDDFLQSLHMISVVEPFSNFSKPRVSQLSQRSNQFNLRTLRYSEQDVETLMQSQDYFTLTFTLEDKYGDNGLICIVVLKKLDDETLFIENWMMSCRVLKRGMEAFTLNTIVEIAQQHGFKKIIGEYLPTAKNDMVKNHYENLGFTEQDGQWILETQNYQPTTVFIETKKI